MDFDESKVILNESFRIGKQAELLQTCFSPGVIDLVKEKSEDGGESQTVAVVKNAR